MINDKKQKKASNPSFDAFYTNEEWLLERGTSEQ
jgi:hypothetical protein